MTTTTPITVPFTVLVDSREKASYRFTGLRADAAQNRRDLIVPTQWVHLKTGDYSIKGLEGMVTVERKSLTDLFSTLGQHRERFEREHQRMTEMRAAMVVIESSWLAILHWPPERSKLNPKVVFRTAASWMVRYGVPWVTAENRRLAEVFTFRFLEKAWREFHGEEEENGESA